MVPFFTGGAVGGRRYSAQGFTLAGRPLPLTLRHRAGVSAYTSSCATLQAPVFLLNSRLSRFSATRFASGARGSFDYRGFPLSRSYGEILPSSFSTVHSRT